MIDRLDNPDQIWQAALGELQLQLTGATFNTWLARSNLLAYEDGVFTVGVHNDHAKEWLENRLQTMVLRTLDGIVGRPVAVRFVVQEHANDLAPSVLRSSITTTGAEPAEPAAPRPFVPVEFNTHEAGWFPISAYESSFWRPLLGRVGWAIWEIIREGDHRKEKGEWTPDQRWTAPTLAGQINCGKQAVTGVNRSNGDGQLHHHGGGFDRLVMHEIGKVSRQGVEPHVIYVVSVRTRLPLLCPAQVKQLADVLQVRHDRWLDAHGFDARDWFEAQ